MNRTDNPQSRLTALLDALEQEVMAAPAEEVRDAFREAGRARTVASREVRGLLNDAVAASEDGSAIMPPPHVCAGSGLHRH